MMGWHKTDVEGRVMWESPDGQRVADPADIPEFRKHPRDTNAPIVMSGVATLITGLVVGFVIGFIVAAMIFGG